MSRPALESIAGGFPYSPRNWVTGTEEHVAVASLQTYFDGSTDTGMRYSGAYFERIADRDRPDEFTASDIVAVSMLGVNIPAHAAAWLLGPGAADASRLLARMTATSLSDSDHDLTDGGWAWQLWRLLRKRRGMGPTKVSKLMAAKRPALVPIYDSVTCRAFGLRGADQTWKMWKVELGADEGHLFKTAEALRERAGVSAEVSPLRVLDVVVWMREHGWYQPAGLASDPAFAARQRLRPAT